MSNSKIILGVLAGAAIGLTAGILLAPESGKATREKIKSRLSDAQKDLEKLKEEAKQAAEDLTES